MDRIRKKYIAGIALASLAAMALAFVLLFSPGSRAGASEQGGEKAQNVTYAVKLEAASGKKLTKLTDSDRGSTVKFSDEDTITVQVKSDYENSIAIAGVYAIWNLAPGRWQMEYGDTVEDCGLNGFIHEYIGLKENVTRLTIRVPAGAELCDIDFYTEGTLPKKVQVWQKPYDQADILLFPSHGDDEHLFFGGIMPYYAGEKGYKVQVAYMTDHKFTEIYRTHEQLDGLWTVGVTAYPVYGGFIDEYSKTLKAAEEMYGADNVETWQVETIRRFKPLVIVGHDFEGEYGHGAHRLNGTMLQKSVPDAADPEKYPDSAAKYGVWDTPKFYSHLYDCDTVAIIEWGEVYLDNFGGESALEMAKKGYKCHDSQQRTRFKVMTDGYGDCRRFGLYRTTVGEDVRRTDLLEHLVPDSELIKVRAPELPADFTPEPTPEPTPTPSPEPTEEPTQEPTAELTELPASDGADVTAPTSGQVYPTEGSGSLTPGENDKKATSSGPLIAVIAGAVLGIAVVAALVLRKKKRG